MTAPTPGPWLPVKSLPVRLNDDLRARGWGIWHHRDGTVTITAPDHQQFVCTDLRAAYETAREYASTRNWDEVTA